MRLMVLVLSSEDTQELGITIELEGMKLNHEHSDFLYQTWVDVDPLLSGASTSVLTTTDGGDTLQWHDIITDLFEDSSIMFYTSHEVANLTHGRIGEDESTSKDDESCIEEVLGKGEYGTQWYDDYSDFHHSSHTLFQYEVTVGSQINRLDRF